jgi:predicted lipoprotein with Yx(FWY)xxD motif
MTRPQTAARIDLETLPIERSLTRMPRSRRITFLAGATVLLSAALAAAGCGSSGSGPPKTVNGRAATLGVVSNNLGKILVDSQGRTLYLFKRDSGATSACTGACASNWPPLRATGKPTVGSGAETSIVATSARSDGEPQVTYNRHPLYLFKGDKKPGDTNGEGLTAFGGGWFALSPAGNQVSGQNSSPGGGYGY